MQMIIQFMIATICLPLVAVETGKLLTATDLELLLMNAMNNVDESAVIETELMTENCYEISINEKD